jgi:hypothetical protein
MGVTLFVHMIVLEGNETRFQEESSAIRGMNAMSASTADIIPTYISRKSSHAL